MSPFAIHEEAMKKQHSMNIMRPQEQVPVDLPQNFGGTMSQGIPVKQIAHADFPRIVYMHPNEPTKVVEHRNDRFEVVGTEVVQTEHLTKKVACAAHLDSGVAKCEACEKALKEAIAEGWVKEPYIPKPLPKADAGLYGPRKTAAKAS
jgi:hypothetical protein